MSRIPSWLRDPDEDPDDGAPDEPDYDDTRPLTTAQADEIKRLAHLWTDRAYDRGMTYGLDRSIDGARLRDIETGQKFLAYIDSLTEPELEDLTDELQAWSGEARQIAEETLPLAVEVWPEPSPVVAPTPAFEYGVRCDHDERLVAVRWDRETADTDAADDFCNPEAEYGLGGHSVVHRQVGPWTEVSE